MHVNRQSGSCLQVTEHQKFTVRGNSRAEERNAQTFALAKQVIPSKARRLGLRGLITAAAKAARCRCASSARLKGVPVTNQVAAASRRLIPGAGRPPDSRQDAGATNLASFRNLFRRALLRTQTIDSAL